MIERDGAIDIAQFYEAAPLAAGIGAKLEFAFTFKVVKSGVFWQTAVLPIMNAAPQHPVPPPTEPPGSDPNQAPAERATKADDVSRPREIGGRGGPEPTRFGDWERAGRCIDF
jgi:hypothetical protein